jgi:hypothetical protein
MNFELVQVNKVQTLARLRSFVPIFSLFEICRFSTTSIFAFCSKPVFLCVRFILLTLLRKILSLISGRDGPRILEFSWAKQQSRRDR